MSFKDKRNQVGSEIKKLQQDARSRVAGISEKLREQISMDSLTEETNFSKAFSKNMAAIATLKRAIANHRMQPLGETDNGATKVEMLRGLMMDTEADLALIEIETELLGHMAHLLSLDAMALAEDVAIQSFDVANQSRRYTSPSDAVSVFVQ